MIAYSLLLVFPAVMIFAALSDLFTLTIPNRLSIILVAVFFPLAFLVGLPLEAVGMHVLAGFGVLVVGFILFATGTFGGGDAKLMAAASLWLGIAPLQHFFIYVALIGGALAVGILLYRRLPEAAIVGPDWALRLHEKKTGIPYGIAISGAALMSFPTTELYRLIAG